MKRHAWVYGTLAWCGMASLAMAQTPGALNGFRHHALPVLVSVDARGHVSQVQPSVELSPRMDRLLRDNLQQMITRPAVHDHKAVSSQFVIQLALEIDKQANSTYAAHFAYVSSFPVPGGLWYWVHVNGHRLGLARDDGNGRRQRLRFINGLPPGILPWPTTNTVLPAVAAPPTIVGGNAPQGMRVPPRFIRH